MHQARISNRPKACILAPKLGINEALLADCVSRLAALTRPADEYARLCVRGIAPMASGLPQNMTDQH